MNSCSPLQKPGPQFFSLPLVLTPPLFFVLGTLVPSPLRASFRFAANVTRRTSPLAVGIYPRCETDFIPFFSGLNNCLFVVPPEVLKRLPRQNTITLLFPPLLPCLSALWLILLLKPETVACTFLLRIFSNYFYSMTPLRSESAWADSSERGRPRQVSISEWLPLTWFPFRSLFLQSRLRLRVVTLLQISLALQMMSAVSNAPPE